MVGSVVNQDTDTLHGTNAEQINSLSPKEPGSVYKARDNRQAQVEEQKDPVTQQGVQSLSVASAGAFRKRGLLHGHDTSPMQAHSVLTDTQANTD